MGTTARARAQKAVVDFRVWAGAIALLAFVIRAIVAIQLSATPLYEQPQLDSLEFLGWAQSISEGDLFRWSAPSHGPGYACFLALLLLVFAGSLKAVALLQAALGAALCVVTASLATKAFRDYRAGIVTGFFLAVYGPLIYLEVSLFAEGLFTFLLVLALWLLARTEKPKAVIAICIGLTIGLACITRATALPFLPLLAVWLFWRPAPWSRRSILWMIAGWAVVVVPVLLILRHTSGGWLPVQAFGGLNFYMGNHPGASGTPEGRLGGTWDLVVDEPARHGITDATERERYFMRKAWKEIGEQPLATLTVIGKKIVWFLQNDEVRDNFQFFRTQSPMLRFLPGFGLLLPFALWGLWLARRNLPPPMALYLLLFAASNILIVVSCRYRIPLIPVMAVLAGGAIVWLADQMRQHQWKQLWPAAALLLMTACIAHVWVHQPSHDFGEEWALTGASLHRMERTAEAEQVLDDATANYPNSALAWYQLGLLRITKEDPAGAEKAFFHAVRLSPYDHSARLYLGLAYKRKGDLDGALRELRQAHWITPDDPETSLELGELLLARGEIAEARTLLQQVIDHDSNNVRAWLALARMEGALRNPKKGMEFAAKATAIDESRSEAWMILAMLSLDAKDEPVAAMAIEHAERLMGANAPAIVFARTLLGRLRGQPKQNAPA